MFGQASSALLSGNGVDEQAGQDKRRVRRSHDLAYVLGEGASVGRNRVLQDAWSVAPLVLLNAGLIVAIYLVVVLRGSSPNWGAFGIVAPSLAAVPAVIALVLVSLRDHEQPITIATFVTVVTVAMLIAILSATRIFMSYSGVLFCSIPTVLVMIVVMMRLKQAQTERVAILDFPGAAAAALRLGGTLPIIRGADTDLGSFDRFLIDAETHYSDKWSRFLLRSYMRGVLVTPWVQFLELRRGRVDINSFDLGDIVLRPSQILYSRAKRLFDIFGVLVTAPISLVVGGLTYLYILMRAGRPVLFTQRRRGYGGRAFTLYKFRTMRLDAGHAAAALGKDGRVVPGLHLVRIMRLDELPQLINILKGEMSMVGPRPEAVELAAAYEAAMPRYVDRLLVRPGLTGWAQVNATASATVEEAREKLAYDLYYLKNMSFDLDLLIMLRTFRTLYLRVVGR
jgi:lipopolysaccharide/colanic/teichoic acid biosynthesis glycosyltransferase